MTCLEFNELFDRLVDQDLAAELTEEMREHLQSCSVCAADAASIVTLNEHLKTMEFPAPSVDLQAALLALGESQRSEASQPSILRDLTPFFAVLVLCVTLWVGSVFLPIQVQLLMQSLFSAAGIAAAATAFLKPRMLSLN